MSINKQGAKIYGGKGPIRYQKQISGIPNLKAKPISTSNGYNDINVSKTMKTKNNSFLAIFKNYYKYILVILIGFFIGGNIGSIGRVPKSLSDEVKLQLKSNATIIQERQAKLDNLNKQLEEISGELGN